MIVATRGAPPSTPFRAGPRGPRSLRRLLGIGCVGLAAMASAAGTGETGASAADDGAAAEAGQDAAFEPTASDTAAPPSPPSPLLQAAAAVLGGDYASVDTAALLDSIQKTARWGEIPDRLIEAQGILLCNRGDWQMGLACLRRLAKPGPQARVLIGQGALRKGDRYEAAARFLGAARDCAPKDARAPGYYRLYLDLKPADAAVEAELADRLDTLGLPGEAALLRIKDPERAAADPAAALRIGALLESQGQARQSLDLYRRAIAKHPADKPLRLRLGSALEAGGSRLEAAQAYRAAWELDIADAAPRDRAWENFAAAGPAGEKPLRALLEKAMPSDSLNPRLRSALARSCLAEGNRAGAHAHLAAALQSDPGNPAYQALLIETLEEDGQILAHFPYLQAEYEKRGGTARLVKLAARGFALSGRVQESARAWFQLRTMAPQDLEGSREAVLALAGSGDPAYLSIAGAIAAPMAPAYPEDLELGRVLLRAQLSDGRYEEAAVQARRLLKSFPAEEADEVLAAAKTMLAMEKPEPAKAVLSDLLQGRRLPEASLLMGGILHGEQDFPAAIDHLEAAADSFAVAWWLLGECLEGLREPLRASLAYHAYYDRTGDKEGLVALARVDRAVNDPAREKATLDAMAAKGLLDEAGKLRLGNVRLSLGDTAMAAAAFDELFRNRAAIPAEPAWVDAGIFLGSRLAAEGRQDRAVRVLAAALRADSARAAAWRLLGECHAARRQWKAAVAAYASAEAAGDTTAALSRLRVDAAKRLDVRKDLADAYASLAARDPSDEEAQSFLAAWHQGERHYLDAAHHYRMLLKARPKDAKAWENLGNCLAMIPDMRDAGEALQKAIDLGAESDEVYLNRARAYRQEGAKDMAASILEFLVARNPRSYLALVWSARFAEEDGRADLATDLFKRAARMPPPKTAWPELASSSGRERL